MAIVCTHLPWVLASRRKSRIISRPLRGRIELIGAAGLIPKSLMQNRFLRCVNPIAFKWGGVRVIADGGVIGICVFSATRGLPALRRLGAVRQRPAPAAPAARHAGALRKA